MVAEERAEAARIAAERDAAGAEEAQRKENTINIFDFDDTLFPTSKYGTEDQKYWDSADEGTLDRTFEPVT